MDPRLGWRVRAKWLFSACSGCALLFGLGSVGLSNGQHHLSPRPLEGNPVSADATSIASGRILYAKHCLACHGPSGRGDGAAGRDLDPAPSDLSQPEVIDKSDTQLFRQITRGRRPMPSFQKLPPEDRWKIIRYVRALADGKHGDGR